MVVVCCVPFCKNNGKTPNVSFHNFTKDPKLKKIWIHKIKRDTVKSKRNPRPFHVSKYTKICSAHFIRENFLIKSEKNRLKADAIPSIFPWSTTENATGRKESHRYHVVVDEIENVHRCDLCPYKTKWISLFKSHIRKQYIKSEFSPTTIYCMTELEKYKCIKCDYATHFFVDLKKHICLEKDPLDLEQYVITQHTNEKIINWFECGHCLLKFNNESN